MIGVVGEEKLQARRGRLAAESAGWSFQQLLVFVSGGYTQARFGQVDFNSAIRRATIRPSTNTYYGWFIGTGYEYGLGFLPGLFWKTEYRFADYGTERLSIFSTSTAPHWLRVDSHKYVHTVRSELVWRFNFGGPVVARY